MASISAFTCSVCFESRSAEEIVVIRSCAHQCCKPCLIEYLRVNIGCGKTHLLCFQIGDANGQQPCQALLTETEIQSLVDADTFGKYERFVFSKQHPLDGRQCPFCDHRQVWHPHQRSQGCVCEACGGTFCFLHGEAHAGSSCESYETTTTKSEKTTLAIINTTTKCCPGCAIPVEKNGGCNHMTCLSCGASFCWICRAFVDRSLTPEHYQGWGFSGCTGLQHVDVDTLSWRHSVQRRVLRVTAIVAVGLPAVILTALATLATFGWYPLRRRYGVTLIGACKRCFELVAATIQDSYVQIGAGVARRSREIRQRLALSK